MKAKLKFVFNILLLAIFDAAIVLNVLEIMDKYPSFSIIENVIVLIITLFVGGILLKETHLQVKNEIMYRFNERYATDEDEYEDFGEEEYSER